MKKALLSCLIILVSITFLQAQNINEQDSIKLELFNRFLEQPDVQATLIEIGILPIAITAYCALNDCEVLLQELGVGFYLGSHEDLFQRTLKPIVIRVVRVDYEQVS